LLFAVENARTEVNKICFVNCWPEYHLKKNDNVRAKGFIIISGSISSISHKLFGCVHFKVTGLSSRGLRAAAANW
jgi:hypothetical protein